MKVIIITTKEEVPAYPPVPDAKKEKVCIWNNEKEERWVANVPDIYQLANTIGEKIIVFPKYQEEDYPTIEIYNDYRE